MALEETGAEARSPAVSAPAKDSPRPLISRAVGAVLGDLDALHPRLRLANAVLFFCPRLAFNRVRVTVYRAIGVRIGPRTMVLGSLALHGPGRIWKLLRIGADCQITTPLFLDLAEKIEIGNNVAVGHHVVMVTTQHDTSRHWRRCGKSSAAPISVEDGCWIGARATILPGVTLGRGSVVAAGAVVTANVEPNTLVGGVPAKPIKKLSEDEGQ